MKQLKKCLFGFACVCLLALALSVKVSAADTHYICGKDATAILDDNGKLTISGTGSISVGPDTNIKTVVIEQGITEIAMGAFDGCSELTSIKIPDSVTIIGDSAFGGCSKLEEITIPSGVTCIEENTFSKCISLEKVTIPNSITRIGNRAFTDCSKLTSITIPNSVASIGERAFIGCVGLTSITISSDNLTSIGSFAFEGCRGLKSIIINAERLTDIGDDAFFECSELTSISINSRSLTSIGKNAFYGCSKLASLAIESSSLTSIGVEQFYGCSGLTSITINSSSLTSVEEGVFSEFSKLESIAITSNSITRIGNRAFSRCSKLKSVTIPSNVSSIGDSAFSECSGLTSITIPGSVTSIGDNAFSWCSGLTRVTVPSSTTSIGNGVFSGCKGLTSIQVGAGNKHFCEEDGVLYNYGKTRLICFPAGKGGTYIMPSSVTEFDGAFDGCTGLESIKVDSRNKAFSDVDGVVYNKGKTKLLLCPEGRSKAYSIPSGIKEIEQGAFCGCSKIKTIIIGKGISKINEGAFSYCSGLTLIIIPGNVKSIGSSAFSDCTGLKELIIQNGVKSIYDGAFAGCESLSTVRIPASVGIIMDGAFDGCPENMSIFYEGNASQWKKVKLGRYAIPSTAKISYVKKAVKITGVKVNPSTVKSLGIGKKATLKATVTPKGVDQTVTWKSNKPGIASVDEDGVVTGRGTGTATIMATSSDGKKTGKCKVTVKGPEKPKSIRIKSSLKVNKGKTVKLSVTYNPKSTAEQYKKVEWSSKDTGIASVDQNGYVTGIRGGSTFIYAKPLYGGKTVKCKVTVKGPINVTGVKLSKPKLTLSVKKSATLKAIITPAKATNKKVTWSTGDKSVVSVTQKGKVTAKKTGTAKITVTTKDGGKTATCIVTVMGSKKKK